MRLTSGTIWSPSFTGSVPPGTKQFCTSTTMSTSLGPGFTRAPAVGADERQPATPVSTSPAAAVFRKCRRPASIIVILLSLVRGRVRSRVGSELVEHQAVQQLGIEMRRLLRQHLARTYDRLQLVHGGGRD